MEGSSSQYTVVLDSEPASNATVGVSSHLLDGQFGVTYNPTSLVFTRNNWDIPQTITVTGLQDDDDNSRRFSTSHWVTVGDNSYWVDTNLSMRVTDDDQEEVRLSTTALTLFEGESRAYRAWLNRPPQNNVTVRPFSVGADFAFEPSDSFLARLYKATTATGTPITTTPSTGTHTN